MRESAEAAVRRITFDGNIATPFRTSCVVSHLGLEPRT
jgi:hypothetical protein